MNLFKNNKLTTVLFLISSLFLINCSDKQTALEKEISQIPMNTEVVRFDSIFYNSKEDELEIVKHRFPYLFPKEMDNQFWINKKRDTLFKELNSEVAKNYTSLDPLAKELNTFFKHVKYYFPEESEDKKILTLVSEVDVAAKAVYADTLVLISLDTYLGKDHRFYGGFPVYLRTSFEQDQILPDLAANFIMQQMNAPTDRTFLGGMIHNGLILYGQKELLPSLDDAVIMGYSKEQLDWAKANESEIWRYFIDNNLLYSTDSKLSTRFLEPAPFSKFYLEIDEEAPGRVGAWVGWQIVNSYMKNNNVTLQELLRKNAREIFEQSKYKPKK
ncbi:gliding motility lipoprotein GldB [Myroides injenensis]|uniref:gliding motility lipoprotein GldB n=1 Tax=Myroides injenensis TaxID=1183151 RepID=UPI0002880493|nr:gliding motility lipoprotein GldB [Myroides injenensis]